MTIMITCLTFLIVWGATALFALKQMKQRQGLENDVRQVAVAVAEQSAAVAAKSAELNLHETVKTKIRPVIEEAMASEELQDKTADQKKYHIILNFIRKHPGTSVDAAERAIEAILSETK